MNAMMNITVRVTAAAARKEIESLRAEVAMLRAQMGMGAAASTGMISAQAFANISRWGSQMQWAGRQLVANFTLPLAAAGYAVTKLVLDNEAAMVRIQKVYGDAVTGPRDFANDVGGLSKAFDLLSVKYATSRADVMNIAADWAAAGAQGGALARGVETTLKTMVLGELDAATATEALIAIQAQYGTDTKGLVGIIETLNATENTTGVTFAGLVEGMSRSASAARSAGVDVDHLAAMIASISPAAGSAGQAGNALKTIFSRMLGPTGEARDVMGAMGINIDDLSWKSLNGAERLERLADAYMHLEGAGNGMVSSQAGIVSAVVASRWQINRFDVLMRDLAYHIDGNSKTNGYYTDTLALLARKSDVAKLAQSELNAVLESNPYAVKRAGVVIQNSLMSVVVALLPQILWLVNSIATLAKKFSELDPGIQKGVIGFLAFLAVLGPPLVLLGSLAVAVGRIGIILSSIGGAASKFFKFFTGLATTALGAITGAIGGALGWVQRSVARVVGMFGVGQAVIVAEAATGGAAAGSAFAVGYDTAIGAAVAASVVEVKTAQSLIIPGSAAWGIAAGRAWAAGYVVGFSGVAPAVAAGTASVAGGGFIARFMAGLKGLGPKILTFLKGIGPWVLNGIRAFVPFVVTGMGSVLTALASAGSAIIAFMTGPWGIAIIAVVALLVIFRKQIGQFLSGIARQVQDSSTPLGKSWQAIVNLWNKGIDAIKRGFRSLPEGVQGSLIAVLDMVKKVALKVYEWFSYLNPFAHHSPSLVENVTNGLAIVGEQFSLVAGTIKNHMLNAYSSLSGFGGAVANFMAKYKAFTQAQERATIGSSAGPGAAAAYDDLIAQLGPLEADLASVSAAMEEQQAISDGLAGTLDNAKNSAKIVQDQFDTLSNTASNLSDSLSDAKGKLSDFASVPIEGMRAMSDAIFDNQMAEKALQLQMLNLNDVSLSDLQGQLASLQGEIESLRGTQADLRASGAGSDVLQVYQNQIDTLQAQGEVIKQQVSPLNDLQNQLDALQKVGQKLDLEQSLAFDPLTRQIEQLSTSYSELPFNEIITSIQSQSAAVDQLQASYDIANTALEQQKTLLDQAKTGVDAAQIAYDSQAQTLDALKQVYSGLNDQIAAIKETIDSVIQAAGGMEASLQAAGGAGGRISPALENFNGAAGGAFPDVGGAMTIGDETGSIDDWLKEFTDSTTDIFSKIDIFTPIKLKWGEFQGWWGANVTPIFTNLWQGVSDTAKSIDWLAPFRGIGDWFSGDSSLGQAASDWWNKIVAPFQKLWDDIGARFAKEKEKLAPQLDKLRDSMGEVFTKLQEAWVKIQPAVKVMGQVFGAVAGAIVLLVASIAIIVANILANVIMPIVNFIMSIVDGIILVFTGFVQYFSGVFTGDWAMAWQGILDIVAGIWDLIYAVFRFAWDLIYGIIKGLVDGIIAAWNWLASIIGDTVKSIVDSVINWFTTLRDNVIGFIVDLVTGVINWFINLRDSVVNFVVDLVTAVVTWFVNLYTTVNQKVSDFVLGIITWFLELRDDVVNRIIDLVGTVVDWFTSLPGKVMTAIGDTKTFLVEKGGALVQGVKDGAENIWTNVKTWFTDLPNKIKSALGNMATLLKDAGKDIIQGFWDGMKEVWNKTKDFVTGIGTWIADHKGPKEYDMKLLVPAGGWIMGGLDTGLKAGLPGILKTVTGISTSILNTAGNASKFAISAMSTDSGIVARSVASGSQVPVLTGGTYGTSGNQSTNFFGDLSFPNITDPNDAKKFLENLSDLAGSGGSR